MTPLSNAPTSARALPAIDAGLRAHMASVYRTMSAGMLITALAAWAISGLSMTAGPDGVRALTPFGQALFGTPLIYVVMFAPLVLIMFSGAAMSRLSSAGLRTAFYGIAAIFGVSMSSLVMVFTGASIVSTFLATTVAFAALSLYGYTTKRDLAPLGAFLIVGLIGLIVVMLINLFVASSVINMAVSVVGILVFAGLTAVETQSTKTQYLGMRGAGAGSEEMGKAATMSALSLYLDFLNLFQFLLQFMGVRRE